MRIRIVTIIILIAMIVGSFAVVPAIPERREASSDIVSVMSPLNETPDEIQPRIETALSNDGSTYPSDLNLADILGDRDNTYKLTYEPWRSKAAIHAIAYDEDTGFLALGGGYLYDNEVHLYRRNVETGRFDKVFELGDGIIRGDVLSLAFGDTDLNSFLEVAVASSDGHVYVFEQRHLYDPYANTENMFDLVWTSPGLFRVFAVKIDDVDRDYRPDIIAGSWDGKVHLYEYDNHSGYPFVEEHWITYREVTTLDIGGKVYSLETGDTNNNGLPEIVVGTRAGKVLVYENAGKSITINGKPFPLIRDNTYSLRWTSENYTWQPIRSIAIGELDGTDGDEIALVAEGQGVFTLDWDKDRGTYEYKKVQRDFADWETYGYHGLDYWVDSVVSANNVAYHDPINASLVIDEPIQYEWNNAQKIFLPNVSIYPYNTGMAQMTDGNYSTFDAAQPGVDNATAIVDFGRDEEGTGSANADADLIITFKEALNASIFSQMNFSIGQTPDAMYQVNSSRWEIMAGQPTKLLIDVDDVLSEQKMDWFRYAKVSIYNGGNYSINSIELLQVYNLLTDALSLTIGPLKTDVYAYEHNLKEMDKIVVATLTGEFISIYYNTGDGKYEIQWESYDNERYTLGAYVWDIENVPPIKSAPIWIDIGALNNIKPDIANYSTWGYGVISPITRGGDGEPYYFVGTDQGWVRAVDMGGNASSIVNHYLDLIETGARKYTSAEVAWLWPETVYGELPMIAVGSYNPDGEYGSPSYYYSRAQITFYTRSTLTDQFDLWQTIDNLDVSGGIAAMLSVSKTVPRMHFVDYDQDGDLDMVVSNGDVYLARNVYAESSNGGFVLEPDYFEQINSQDGGVVWGQPTMADIDQDGDLDLVLSYDEKYGATCFINHGTNMNPIWKEDRRLFANSNPATSMNIMKLRDVRLVPNVGGYTHQRYAESAGIQLQGNYSLAAYSETSGKLRWAIPDHLSMDSYLVATYPRVSMIDFALLDSEAFRNLGFHIHESWNTDFDLKNWTLSITAGDLDNDGRGEIIVGDYDNNVYAFEHMTNNTYKRMFRSFDLNHTVVTDVSPYAYEDLEGISGDFKRKIWDHAEYMLADVDLDQDMKKELVVVSGLQFYIFEATGIDDTIGYAYSFDLRNLTYLEQESSAWKKVSKITALAGGIDLDNDGRKELAVAAGPFLLIFNVDKGSFEGMEQNEIFGMYGDEKGRYALFGNPEASAQYQNAQINTLAVGDTDRDGLLEVIISGTEDDTLFMKNGLLKIYECVGGVFQSVWDAPATVTDGNPISSVVIDDQDYDGLPEIIVGSTKAIDIFEWIDGTDSQYRHVKTVTSSPNYPKVKLTTIDPLGVTYSNRCMNDLAWDMTGNNNYAYEIYCDNKPLGFAFYKPATGLWTPFGTAFTATSYEGGNIVIDYEYQPSLLSTKNGTYLTWKARRNTGRMDFWISKLNYSSSKWGDPVWLMNNTDFFGHRNYPDVFEYNATHLGVLYTREASGNSEIYYVLINKTLTGPRTAFKLTYPGQDTFYVSKASIVNMPSGGFTIAMSAVRTDTTKGDYDIWSMHSDRFNFSNVVAHQATSSFYNELSPDVDYLWSDNTTIVVAYEREGAPFEHAIGLVSSRNNGSTWSPEEELNTYPAYFTRVDFPGYYYYMMSGMPYTKPMAFSPSIVGGKTGGFMYVIGFSTKDAGLNKLYTDIVFGVNPSSEWAESSVHDIANLVVGDTDSDGRREIIGSIDNRFVICELKNSTDGLGNMYYHEAYVSDSFENTITGLTVFDTNGNGWEEIGVSSKYGETFVFEYRDPSHGATKFTASTQVSNSTFYGGILINNLASGDVDDDGRDELIMNIAAGGFTLYDDDGTMKWNVTSDDLFQTMDLVDLNADGILEIVAIQWGESSLLAYNSSDGSLLWNLTAFTDDLGAIDFGDIDGDGVNEIVVSTDDGKIWTVYGNGTVWHSEDTGTTMIWGLAVGDFTNNTMLDVAYANGSYAVKVISPLDGTIYYETPTDMVGHSFGRQPMVAADFDGDGYDDIAFGNSAAVRMANAMKKTIFYNSTISSQPMGMQVADFDGDDTDELFVLTQHQGAYLVETGTLRLQWQYQANVGQFRRFATGRFGGTGAIDIAMLANYSIVIALDGKNGHPLWVNYTAGDLLDTSAADFDHDGIDTVFAARFRFGWSHTHLLGYESQEFASLPTDTSYDLHKTYWEIPDIDVDGMWTNDVDNDGYDEVFIVTHSRYLSMWDAYHGTMVWNISMGGDISQVRFGLLQSGLDNDLGVLVDHNRIVLLDSSTHSTLTTIGQGSGYYITDFLIADFDMAPYDDIAVLYESSSRMRSFVSWYDSDGSWKYSSGSNATNGYAHIAMGYFRGDVIPDIVYGGKNGSAIVLNGDGGALIWKYDLFTTIYGLVAGNFDGDSKEDFAVETSSVVYVANMTGQKQLYSVVTGLDNLREFYAADVYGSSTEELILNLRNDGVKGYNATGQIVWDFEARLVYSSYSPLCTAAFDDFNADGTQDLVMTNAQYAVVIDGSTKEILWNYASDGKIYGIAIGDFDGTTGEPDVIAYGQSGMFVIAGEATPPQLPSPSEEPPAQSPDLWIGASIIGIPFMAALVIVIPRIKKRRLLA